MQNCLHILNRDRQNLKSINIFFTVLSAILMNRLERTLYELCAYSNELFVSHGFCFKLGRNLYTGCLRSNTNMVDDI